MQEINKKKSFIRGIKYGIPIGLGYFAVSFSLGIMAKKVGLSWYQGYLASFLNMASAGQYALFRAIGEHAGYLSLMITILVINARYLLMSCALGQRFNPKTGMLHRFLVGFFVTDEIFGVTISENGDVNPYVSYGMFVVSSPCWCVGTALGIVAGNVLPATIVSALSVALYGMFIAIIIPQCKKKPAVLIAVASGFVFSYLFTIIPVVKEWSEGNRTIILTVVIAAVIALLKPVEDDEDEIKENS